jgi:hypothetical protein
VKINWQNLQQGNLLHRPECVDTQISPTAQAAGFLHSNILILYNKEPAYLN